MFRKDQEGASTPRVTRQAWDLARSLAAFVSDGCRLVSAEQYRQRLEICDGCARRVGNRCRECGCRLALKAGGRAFRCSRQQWPAIEP